MRSRRGAWGCVLLWFAMLTCGGMRTVEAQGVPASPTTIPADTEAELHAMTRLAGVIFAGRVTAVRRLDGSGGATGVVEIEFAVDDAVRGVSGGTYTLREWAGLWAANEPFRVGQRYLMLLHAPGLAGLSSPVGGADGAIPIRTGGLQVDLRWVATRVVRPVSYGAAPVGRPTAGIAALANGMSAGATQVELTAPELTDAAAAGGADYASVARLLRGWEKAGDAAR